MVRPDGRVPFAANTLAAISPADAPAVVRRPADLQRAPARRIALAQGSSPLGGYTRAYLQSLGLYDALVPRAVFVDNAAAVTAAVRVGRADVGLVYGSEAARAVSCRVLFHARRLPVPIRYVAALMGQGPVCGTGPRPLLDFFTSGEAAASRFAPVAFLAGRPAPAG